MIKGTRASPVVIYTDGSCLNYKTEATRNEKGHGGWAFVVVREDGPNIYGKGFAHAPQTNNTMELQAVLEALRWVHDHGLENDHILIRPDSLYVINGMISAWRHVAAETNIEGELNGEIWRKLHRYAEKTPRLRFAHVKGHTGKDVNKHNEMCDRIASTARKQGISKLRANVTE
jgi:ribonuclease HI